MPDTDADQYAWHPSPELVEASNATAFLRELDVPDYDALITRAAADPAWFWGAVVSKLAFHRPPDQVLDKSRGAPFARWCIGGRGNLVLSALDRHRDTPTWSRDAIVWEGEDGAIVRWNFAELDAVVSRLAGGLLALGLQAGEAVGLFLPNIPHAIAAYLACAKAGLVALPLFSGFGAAALADRMQAAGAAALITADGTKRRGTTVPMKAIADEAAASLPALRQIVVVRHTAEAVAWTVGRDYWIDELPGAAIATVELDADAPLMLMYTSGTTGKPKGTIQTHAGFAAKMLLDVGIIMDLKPTDRMLWMSDMGWLVGPMVAVAAPLHGVTLILAEGAPDYPDRGRMWRLIDQHRVTFLGLAPTTARSFMGANGGGVDEYELSSLRICISTGEVWTPAAWHWTFEHVCRGRVPILNYSGGTEVGGGILSGTVLHPIKPCAFARAIPGMAAAVVDEAGQPVPPGTVGELVLTGPSIGLTRGLWRDERRYLQSYWEDLPGLWRHGDRAMVDADGQWTIHGRSDDTLKIAGKRTGPSEIEGLLAGTGLVVDCAAVGLPDPVKGQALCCVVTPLGKPPEDLRERLEKAVVQGLGTPFRPRTIIVVDELPKTRNMKVMRRVIRAVLSGDDPGDLSSLLNPEAVASLRERVAALPG